MQQEQGIARALMEYLLAWVAFTGYVLWSSLWPFLYALQGGWGGTPSFHPLFVLWILSGYVAYGLVVFFTYRFFGRVRFLPWQGAGSPFRDFIILLIVSALALIYYLLFFIHGNSLHPHLFA